MDIIYSHDFRKTARKLSGKVKESLLNALREVSNAQTIQEISDCKKLVEYKNTYRIRIGDYRAFFNLYIHIEGNTARFTVLAPRGQAYDKANTKRLRQYDN